MARVTGIQIEKDSKGRPAYARINLKKHPEAIKFLSNIGAIDNSFEKEWADSITGAELKQRVLPRIKKKIHHQQSHVRPSHT